jgi:hypothetical protein
MSSLGTDVEDSWGEETSSGLSADEGPSCSVRDSESAKDSLSRSFSSTSSLIRELDGLCSMLVAY